MGKRLNSALSINVYSITYIQLFIELNGDYT